MLGTRHEVPSGRRGEEQRLLVGRYDCPYIGWHDDKSQFVTYRDPILRRNTRWPVRTRRTQCEMEEK